MPDDPLRVGYYVDLDLAAWGRQAIGEDFAAYVEAHHEPLDIVMALAQDLRHGAAERLAASTARRGRCAISLANLDADDYEAIGRDLKAVAEQRAFAEWRRAQKG